MRRKGEYTMQKKLLNHLIALVAIVAVSVGALSACSGNDSSGDKSTNPPAEATNKDKSFNDTIVFDDLEITFKDNYEFGTVNNQFSDYNGSDVIKLPMTIKNIKDETHGLNIFYYKTYGPDGTAIKELNSYFDDSLDFAGDMRSGASQNTYLYVLYDGDGDYYVEFSTLFGKAIEVKLPITKAD